MNTKEAMEKLEQGWDTFVEYRVESLGENFWTDLYWYAYKYMENNDPDGGVCFKLREDAIEHLI